MITDMTTILNAHTAKDLDRESRRVEAKQPASPREGVSELAPNRPVSASASPQPAAKPASSVSKVEVRAAVEQMQDYAQVMSRQLQFDVDEDSGRTVIRVLDKDSGDVIRQIPSEEVLALAKQMKELMEAESTKIAGKGTRDQPVGLLMETLA